MDEKKILKMLDDEVDSVAPKTIHDSIMSTPIRTKSEAKSVKETKRSFFSTRAFKIMCACMVCVAVLAGVLTPVLMMNSGGQTPGGEGPVPPPAMYASSSYVSLNINPSIDYVVDKDGKVVNVISRNNDGDILLSHGFRESLVGGTLDNAVNKTVDQAIKLGYIDAKVTADNKQNLGTVKLSIASDNEGNALEILNRTIESTSNYLKNKGVLAAVGGNVIDKHLILGNTGIGSIDDWNEMQSDKGGFYFANSVVGKTEKEIADAFKKDFIGEHIEEAFDDMLEDIEDMLDVVKDIMLLETELKNFDGIIIHKDYWDYMDDIAAGKELDIEIADIVEEISEKIAEFNDALTENVEDEDIIITMDNIFYPIDSKYHLSYAERVYDKYYGRIVFTDKTGKEKLEEIIGKIADDVTKVDELFDGLKVIFDGFADVSDKLLGNIKDTIDKATLTVEEYTNICKGEIDRAYNNLVNRHADNIGSVDSSSYDELLDDLMDGLDFDDFWESVHKK